MGRRCGIGGRGLMKFLEQSREFWDEIFDFGIMMVVLAFGYLDLSITLH